MYKNQVLRFDFLVVFFLIFCLQRNWSSLRRTLASCLLNTLNVGTNSTTTQHRTFTIPTIHIDREQRTKARAKDAMRVTKHSGGSDGTDGTMSCRDPSKHESFTLCLRCLLGAFHSWFSWHGYFVCESFSVIEEYQSINKPVDSCYQKLFEWNFWVDFTDCYNLLSSFV